jgi:hypothetical protein
LEFLKNVESFRKSELMIKMSQVYRNHFDKNKELMKINTIQCLDKNILAEISNKLFVRSNEMVINLMEALEKLDTDPSGLATKTYLTQVLYEYGKFLTKETDIIHLNNILNRKPEEQTDAELITRPASAGI